MVNHLTVPSEMDVDMDIHIDIDIDDGESEESDWEYEYNPSEKEDFYLVLDIPTTTKKLANPDIFAPTVPPKPMKPKRKPSGLLRGRGRGSKPRGGASRASENERPAEAESQDGDENAEDDQNMNEDAPVEPFSISTNAANEKAASTPNEFQLMDLNSDNPIISYEGSLYSCQWASSIGSDLLFVKRPVGEHPQRRVLHSFDEWDLLSFSTAKLVASPATFQRRQISAASRDQGGAVVYETENKTLQADFIKRLADIKRIMGEPIGNMLNSVQPTVPPAPIAPAAQPKPKGKGSRGGTRGRGRGRAVAPTVQPRPAPLASATTSLPTPVSWPTPAVQHDASLITSLAPTNGSFQNIQTTLPTPASWSAPSFQPSLVPTTPANSSIQNSQTPLPEIWVAPGTPRNQIQYPVFPD